MLWLILIGLDIVFDLDNYEVKSFSCLNLEILVRNNKKDP